LGRVLTIRLAVFFLLTFALTWTAWLSPAKFRAGSPIFLLGVFAPAIVSLALTAQAEGRSGVARLLARIGKWEVGARYYLFALLYMAATKLLAASIHRIVRGAWPAFGDESVLVMIGSLFVSTWVQAGEEIGWRGYALPRLARSLGPGAAAVLLGVIWALWHLPLFLIPGSGSDGLSFPLYLSWVTAVSVALAWLYGKTGGSLLLTMLMHAAVNNTTFVPLAPPAPVDPMSFDAPLIAWTTVAVLWAIAIVLLWQMRGTTRVPATVARSGP
jgi:membrane protease YdiL (CAAX protease family)